MFQKETIFSSCDFFSFTSVLSMGILCPPVAICVYFPPCLCYTLIAKFYLGGQNMTKDHTKQIRSILGIVTAVSIVIAGICLMVACYGLYTADNFTPDSVAAAFSKICVPVYICLALVIAGFVADFFLPEAEKAPKKRKSPKAAEPAKLSKQTLSVKAVLLVLAIALLLYGFFTGGTVDVLTKAVNICTECVGLG